MSLFKIAYRSIQHRGLASALTAVSMALGVMLVVIVLSIHGVVWESFQNNSSFGYNMIVGAKGGRLQLTLNTVYYLSKPVENIDYAYYLEFASAEQRSAEYQNSVQAHAQQALWETIQLQSLAGMSGAPDPSLVAAGLLADQTLEQTALRHADVTELIFRPDVVSMEMGRPGKLSQFTTLAIPVCLGDYFGRFRVVGTTPDMFDALVFGPHKDRKFEFSSGRNFVHHSEENGYFEAVVGATVAREMKVAVGDRFSPTHGDPDGHGHERKFTVVGVLKPSGTPQDRAVFVNMEGFFLMEDHAKPIEDEGVIPDDESLDGVDTAHSDHDHDHVEPLPIEQREVTAILVTTFSNLVAPGLQNSINEGKDAQAVFPVLEIYNLFDAIVQPIQYALLALTTLICIVSGISILVSIYNSMSDRRHEIAVMRALGAGRGTVMWVILLESTLLSLAGGVLGWILGHSLNWAASGRIEQQTGVRVGFFSLAPGPTLRNLAEWGRCEWALEWSIGWLPENWQTFAWENITELWISTELMLVPSLILLAVIVGFLPALSAYRTDVSRSLS